MRDSTAKDLRLLRGTLIYIEDIEQTLNRFGRDYETFYHDRVFFNAISMCLMQIGEYTVGNSGFSEEFKEKNSGKVDWKRLRNMRNMFAHSYSTMWNGNSFFDKFYKVQNFFPYAIPIVLDNEPPRM